MSSEEERLKKEEERLSKALSRPGGGGAAKKMSAINAKPEPAPVVKQEPVKAARPASERNYLAIEEENKKKKHEEEEAKKAALRIPQATGEILETGATHIREGVDDSHLTNTAMVDPTEALKLEEARLNRNLTAHKEDPAEIERKLREEEEKKKRSEDINAKAAARLKQWEEEKAKKDAEAAAVKAKEEEEMQKKLAGMNLGNLLGVKMFKGAQ